MIGANWLLYSVLVGGLMTLAAWQGGRALRATVWPSRWGWVLAGLMTVGFPMFAIIASPGESARILPVGPAWHWPAENRRPALPAGSSLAWEPRRGTPFPFRTAGLLLWAAGSALAACWVVVSHRSLARQRRDWRRGQLLSQAVAISPDFGPAVVGIRHPEIVIPEWVTRLGPEELDLVLRHEREHLQSHDTRLLGLMMALLVIMPWHPFLWLQLAGLRLAIELDCDRRVLAAGPAVRRYGELLLEVAGRMGRGRRGGGWSLPLVALWAPASALERRIREISTPIPARRLPAAASLGLASTAVMVACATRPPVTPTTSPSPAMEPSSVESEHSRQQAMLEGRLARYFAAPTVKAPPESTRIYWLVSEPDGSVVRHGEGGRELLWWSEEAYRTRFPWMYRHDQAQADSTGRVPSSRRGVFVLSNGEVYKRFPDLGERRFNSYGLIPAAFGVDSVMVVWAVLQD